MLGSIRFFLAFFVLVSHLPNDGMKLNLGVVSVICFYFISGFLMRKSYFRFVKYSKNPTSNFYIDRVIKIFPQYLLVVAITFICIGIFGQSEAITLLNQEITVSKVLLNVSLLPVNYAFIPFAVDALKPVPIIPPAWSLSTELHFYLLLPIIFFIKKPYWTLLLLVSLSIQFSSFFFSSGDFNSDSFGYRYIFGVLTIFLYGYAFARNEDFFYKVISLSIWMMFVVFLFVVSPAFNIWKNPMVQEVLFGGFIALPLGYFFTSVKVKSETALQIDTLLGNLAYPMFISHFLSFYLVEKLLAIQASERVYFYLSSITLCFVISFFLHLFQKSVEKYRINRRGFKSLRDQKLVV